MHIYEHWRLIVGGAVLLDAWLVGLLVMWSPSHREPARPAEPQASRSELVARFATFVLEKDGGRTSFGELVTLSSVVWTQKHLGR